MRLNTLNEYIKKYGNITLKELNVIINTDKKERLINDLINERDVEFEHLGQYFNIYESESVEGFMIDIYESQYHYEQGYQTTDGGLCTGSERDAIEFMTLWEGV